MVVEGLRGLELIGIGIHVAVVGVEFGVGND